MLLELIDILKYTNKELKNDNKEKAQLVETLVRELTDLDIAMHKKDDHISNLTMKKSNLETINQALNNAKVMLEKECNELEDEIDELENTPLPVLLSHTVMLPPLASPAPPPAAICLIPRKISIKSAHSKRSRSRSRRSSRSTSKVTPMQSINDITDTTSTVLLTSSKDNNNIKKTEEKKKGEGKEEECKKENVVIKSESKVEQAKQESKIELRKTSVSSSSSSSSSANTHLTSESSTIDN